jgi:4-amino-4-deoxy-L-arabinose transferase-like glycosyltransferase
MIRNKITSFLKSNWIRICLIIITITGSALRFYNLGFQGRFSEEVFTFGIIKNSYYQILLDPFLNHGFEQPPLYYFLSKLSSDLIGAITLESIRLPAAIFGIIGIPAIYRLGKKYHSETTGLIAALIYALSERMVFYSQYGRPYTLVFFFFIVTAYCFVNIQKGEPFRKWMLLFASSSILCLWSHYFSIVPLSILWLILIWQYRLKMTPYLIAIAIATLSFGMYILNLIVSYITRPVSELYPASSIAVTWFDNLTRVPYECWGYMGLILIPLAILYLIKSKDKIALSFMLTTGVTYLSMLILTLVFNPSARYAVLIAPLIIILAAIPISDIIPSLKNTKQKIALIIGIIYLIIITNAFVLISWYTTTYRFVFI